jgi:rubrerythrin
MADDLRKLIRQLQGAHAGELAAAFAYRGHWKSVRNAEERERIRTIEAEELHHRKLVAGLLAQAGARPNKLREVIFWCIGRTLGTLCHVSGWFIPMYGAGRLERSNIVEYEDAAEYALRAGHAEMIDCLLDMAEVEWEHERYFRERLQGHWLTRFLPLWDAPPVKESIRARWESQELRRLA